MKSLSAPARRHVAFIASMSVLALSTLAGCALAGCAGSNGDWSHGISNTTLLQHMDSTGTSPYRQGGR